MWAKTDASFAGLATASPRSIFVPAATGLEQEPDALLGLVGEQQVVVAEMRPRHVPMEVLGLHLEREYVCEQRVQRAGDVLSCSLAQAGRGLKRCLAAGSHGLPVHGASFLWGKGRNCAPGAGVAVKFQAHSA